MWATLGAAPRWVRLLVGGLAAVLLLAVGYSGRLIVEHFTTPGDRSPEAGFARDMSTHHAQAVQMAMLVYTRGQSDEVHTIAYNIATSQSVEIGIMHTWLQDWHLSLTPSQPRMAWMPGGGTNELSPEGLMPGMATKDDIDQLRKATGKAADILFCRLMLRHHLGGLHMVDGILQLTSRPEVREVVEGMRIGQSGEVTRMQQLLTELGV
jgi:uncharacterized protein (DUF305 family)